MARGWKYYVVTLWRHRKDGSFHWSHCTFCRRLRLEWWISRVEAAGDDDKYNSHNFAKILICQDETMACGVRCWDTRTRRALTNCVLKFWLTPNWPHFIHARDARYSPFFWSISNWSPSRLEQNTICQFFVCVEYLISDEGRWHLMDPKWWTPRWAEAGPGSWLVWPDIAWLRGLRCIEDAAPARAGHTRDKLG